jgi:hypothetical protein
MMKLPTQPSDASMIPLCSNKGRGFCYAHQSCQFTASATTIAPSVGKTRERKCTYRQKKQALTRSTEHMS